MSDINLEPEVWMFQHEETGRTMFIEHWQVENGFEDLNPRLQKIKPIYNQSSLTARVAKLESVLCEISNMCIGNLTMSYSLDADHIGQSIYEATGMSNPELNDSVKEKAGE